MSDYMGAALMFDALPKATAMLGDRGYDADWFRGALTAKNITPWMPPKINRKVPIPHEWTLYRQRHKIKNMFGRLKDWRPYPPLRSLPTTLRVIGAVRLLRPLRPMRAHLHVRHRNRRNRHLLGCDQ